MQVHTGIYMYIQVYTMVYKGVQNLQKNGLAFFGNTLVLWSLNMPSLYESLTFRAWKYNRI